MALDLIFGVGALLGWRQTGDGLAVFDRLAVGHQECLDRPVERRRHFVRHAEHVHESKRRSFFQRVARLGDRIGAVFGPPMEDADVRGSSDRRVGSLCIR